MLIRLRARGFLIGLVFVTILVGSFFVRDAQPVFAASCDCECAWGHPPATRTADACSQCETTCRTYCSAGFTERQLRDGEGGYGPMTWRGTCQVTPPSGGGARSPSGAGGTNGTRATNGTNSTNSTNRTNTTRGTTNSTNATNATNGTNATNATDPEGGAGTDATNETGSSGSSRGGSRQERSRDYSRNFPNPLPGLTLQKTIGGIVRIMVGIVGILFLLVFMWGSFLYMTAAGDPKQTQKGKDALKNAVIGLGVVMIAYTAVSLIIETAGTLMGTTSAPTVSQEEAGVENTTNTTNNSTNQTPEGGSPGAGMMCACTCTDSSMEFRPTSGVCTNSSCGVTCTTVCSGHGGVREAACAEGEGGADSPAPGSTGTAADACMRWYSGPPSNCYTGGGSCPRGANTIEDLFRIWGARLPGGSTPASQAACRSCITEGISRLSARYPGLDMTCMPAVVGAWITDCGGACNGTGPTPETGTTAPEIAALCTAAAYRNDASCRACLQHATEVLRDRPTSEEAQNITRGTCPTPGGNAIVWCASGHPGWSARGSICSFR